MKTIICLCAHYTLFFSALCKSFHPEYAGSSSEACVKQHNRRIKEFAVKFVKAKLQQLLSLSKSSISFHVWLFLAKQEEVT